MAGDNIYNGAADNATGVGMILELARAWGYMRGQLPHPVIFAAATAKQFGLAIVPDPRPEAGTYYRSDHFSLSRVGVPAFSVDPGMLYEGHDRAWGEKKFQDFEDHDYHNFSDNYHPEWDFAGNAKLLRFGMDLGWQVLNSKHPIVWN